MYAGVPRFDDIELGRQAVIERAISDPVVRAFAELSGDRNPLHLDETFAASTPFRRRVAHGMLTAAIVSAAHTKLTGPGFVYVGQGLEFKGPVFIDDVVTVSVKVLEKKPAKKILVLETRVTKQDGSVVLEGRSALKELRIE